MQGLHCWAEAIYQSPIPIAKHSKSILSLLKYPKDGIRRIQEFEPFGRRMLSEIYSGLLSIIMQCFGDQLDVGSHCISSGRHEVDGSYVCLEEMGYGKGERRFNTKNRSVSSVRRRLPRGTGVGTTYISRTVFN